jgi:hypothetical protein
MARLAQWAVPLGAVLKGYAKVRTMRGDKKVHHQTAGLLACISTNELCCALVPWSLPAVEAGGVSFRLHAVIVPQCCMDVAVILCL